MSEEVTALERSDSGLPLLVLGAAALVVWAAFGALFMHMYGLASPHGAGFDFELLLVAARRIASGVSPYDPAMLSGMATGIADLFYTYPPVVAQVLVPFAGLPPIVVIAGFLGGAVLCAALALGSTSAAAFGVPRSRAVLLALVALPLWFPFTLALLFANLDASFVAADAVLLAAVLSRSPWRPRSVLGGVLLGLMVIAKLQPAVLGIWLVARGWRAHRMGTGRDAQNASAQRWSAWAKLPIEWQIAAVALVVGALTVAASVVVGGPSLWGDYLTMLRTSTGTGLLDPRNLGPAAQVSMLLGLGSSAVGPLQAVIELGAVIGAVAAALLVDDPLTSFAWALVATLVVLPVTWFHHFAVLLVVLVAGLARAWSGGVRNRRRAILAVAVGLGVGVVGFGTVAAWLLLVPVLAAARAGRIETRRAGHAELVETAG